MINTQIWAELKSAHEVKISNIFHQITPIPATASIFTVNHTGLLMASGISSTDVGQVWLINLRSTENSSGYSGGGTGNAVGASIHVVDGDRVQIYYSGVNMDSLKIAEFM